MDNKVCKNCDYWTAGAINKPTSQGRCRRYAPPVNFDKQPYPQWAITKQNDWCGDFRHTEKPKAGEIPAPIFI